MFAHGIKPPQWHYGGNVVGNLFELKATGFDRLFSFLLAAILLIAFLVAGLFAIWLTAVTPDFKKTPGEPGEELIGMDLTCAKPAMDFLEPDLPEATTQDLSTVLASLPAAVEVAMNAGDGIKGIGKIPGDREPPPPNVTEGLGFERWRIEYHANSFEHYKKQLQGLGIQFGLVHEQNNSITRLSGFIKGYTTVASDRATENDSVYVVPVKSSFRRWDSRIAREADCDMLERFIVHFLPAEAVQEMLRMEQRLASSQSRTVQQIKQTRFKVVESNGGFHLEIAEIGYSEHIPVQTESKTSD